MENHPIPQDITGFQFKLIGDMTIKQFAFLVAGVILGWITFILPIFILIKLPFVLLFVGFGVAAAFVPIGGRPFDIMIANYLKALLNPTQYVYQKIGGHMWFPEFKKQQEALQTQQVSPDSTQRLKDFLKSLPQKPKNKLDEKELFFLNSLSSLSTGGQINQGQQPAPYQQLEKVQLLEKTAPKTEDKKENLEDNLKTEAEVLKKQLEEAKLAQTFQKMGSAQYETAHVKALELEKLLQEVQSQKLTLENQIIELRKKLEMKNQNVFAPSVAQPKIQTQTVRRVPKELVKSLGLPLIADVPNLIAGIIKDPRGNPLPNILVEVKDDAGNPVRAFKTNVLGQFISATPLANGVYTISFEDPKAENKFDTIELRVIDEILMPIEIISLDTREELRRSLFIPAKQKT
ncbi:MAG: PrgI family protein [Patescibacteria group bacterium]